MLDNIDQALKHLGQGTTGLPGPDHAAIQGRKHFFMLAKGLIQTGAFFYILMHGAQDTF